MSSLPIMQTCAYGIMTIACGRNEDDELCDLRTALASSHHRTIQVIKSGGTSGKSTDVSLQLAGAGRQSIAQVAKLNIHLLDECAGLNCSAQLDTSHGGVGEHSSFP